MLLPPPHAPPPPHTHNQKQFPASLQILPEGIEYLTAPAAHTCLLRPYLPACLQDRVVLRLVEVEEQVAQARRQLLAGKAQLHALRVALADGRKLGRWAGVAGALGAQLGQSDHGAWQRQLGETFWGTMVSGAGPPSSWFVLRAVCTVRTKARPLPSAPNNSPATCIGQRRHQQWPTWNGLYCGVNKAGTK